MKQKGNKFLGEIQQEKNEKIEEEEEEGKMMCCICRNENPN